MDNIEIERKWSITKFPDLPYKSEEFTEQGYLSFNPSVRIRKKLLNDVESFTLTIKAGEGLCKTEVEFPINETQYNSLYALLIAPSAKKR